MYISVNKTNYLYQNIYKNLIMNQTIHLNKSKKNTVYQLKYYNYLSYIFIINNIYK